ncbi:MAG: YihY/virulence factor BrkB family protein [Niameybacter sp.]
MKKRYIGHEIASRSAQITYYWILAFFPFLLMVISILTFTNIAQSEFMKYIADVIPAAIMPFIEQTINQLIEYRSATLLSVSAIAAMWSASAGVNALIRGIHKAYSAVDERAFWVRKLVAMFYALMLAVLIAGMIVLLVFGNRIGEYIIHKVGIQWQSYRVLWDFIRFTLPVGALLVALYIIYKFVPRKHLRDGNVWPGTLFASVAWYAFSYLFSLYVDKFSKYNQMYGSIGSIFILIIWLYMSGMLVLIGAEMNALYQDMKHARPAKRRREERKK